MDFAVVIPAFDDREHVLRAIASALTQDLVREVIVVDDGSSDDTAVIAATTGDPRVRIIGQTNSGPAGARNAGAAASSASHLVFLDADDHLLDGAIGSFGEAHRKGAALVRAGAAIKADGSERLDLPLADPHPFPRGTPLAGTFSIERTLFERIGGYDERFRYGENSELLLRAQQVTTPAILQRPTVQVVKRSGRSPDHYLHPRLAAVDLMFAKHAEVLRNDPETRQSHHGIASNLSHQLGDRRASRSHAWRAAMAKPGSARSWARLARAVAT